MDTFISVSLTDLRPSTSAKQDGLNARQRYKNNHPDRVRASDREQKLRRYGISVSEYETLFAEQDGLCAICHNPETTYNRSLSVDHNHVSYKVRGLLCLNCNRQLGWYEREMFGIHSYLARNE